MSPPAELHRPFDFRTQLPAIGAVGGGLVIGLAFAFSGFAVPAEWRLLQGAAGPFACAIGLVMCWLLPLRWQAPASAWWTVSWFMLALMERWTRGASDGSMVGGLLPYSDAHNYMQELNLLTENGSVSAWGSRRPLATAYLLVFHWLSGRNLHLTVALLVITTALAAWMAGHLIRRRYGVLAAAGFVAVVFIFYRRFIGSTLSESGGLTFGLLGTALVLEGVFTYRLRWLALGNFVLAVGLSIRAGPFFILFVIVVLGAWLWRKQRRVMVTALVLAISGFAGLGTHFMALKVIGDRGEIPFTNHYYVVYGLIMGGNWTKIKTDHPELANLPPAELSRAIYALMGEAIRKEPSLVWKGVLRAWREFLTASDGNFLGPYAFAQTSTLERLLRSMGGIGIMVCMIGARYRPADLLLLGLAFAVLISIPFAPSWDADLMRAYAVAIPMLGLLAARPLQSLTEIALSLGNALSPRLAPGDADHLAPSEEFWPIVALAGLLVVAALGMALGASKLIQWQPQVSIEGSRAVLNCDSGNILSIVSNDSQRPPIGNSITQSVLINNMDTWAGGYPDEADYLRRVAKAGISLAPGGSTDVSIVLFTTPHVSLAGGPIRIQGRKFTLNHTTFFVENGLDLDPAAKP